MKGEGWCLVDRVSGGWIRWLATVGESRSSALSFGWSEESLSMPIGVGAPWASSTLGKENG